MTNGQKILRAFSNAKILCISKYDGRVTTCDKNIGHGFPKDYFCADGERRE